MSVHRLFPRAADMHRCMLKLAEHAEDGTFTGIAFIGYIEGRGWIADACGLARVEPEQAEAMLPALEKKLARFARRPRRS